MKICKYRASSAAPEADLEDGTLVLEPEMDAVQMRCLGVLGGGEYSARGINIIIYYINNLWLEGRLLWF